jgi:hypothetical protein
MDAASSHRRDVLEGKSTSGAEPEVVEVVRPLPGQGPPEPAPSLPAETGNPRKPGPSAQIGRLH